MSEKFFQLTNPDSGASNGLPLVEATLGPPGLDVRKVFSEQGVFTYDPGFASTCSCDSDITFIDGQEGRLLHRGYSIEDLARQHTFTEVAFLFLYGELPTERQLGEFEQDIHHHTMIDVALHTLFKAFHYDAPPMAMLTGVVGSLSAFYHEETDINDPADRDLF